MQKLLILDKIKFFDGLTEQEKETVSNMHLRIFKYDPHTTIIRESDQDNHLYFLIKGTATVVSNQSLPVAILQPGEVFGEISFLAPRPRSASVVANSEVIAIRVDKEYFRQLEPSLREKFKDKLITILIDRLCSSGSVVLGGGGSGSPFDWTYDD